MYSRKQNVTDALIAHIKEYYGEEKVPLHRPIFEGNERQYLMDCIDSNFVSSVGARVNEFEQHCVRFTGARHAVAATNGTAALHMAMILSGVEQGDEVLTQSLTFVATCNAISYIGANPVFIDVDRDTMGLSPIALAKWLENHTELRDGRAFNRTTGARVTACVPMHTFGLPLRIAEVAEICCAYGISLIEDAAESLGSYVGDQHTGTFGALGTLSFNGNKVITTGGGGMILADKEVLAKRGLYLTTTAKVPHPYEFVHDEIGYNYRLPNLNAALGCAQMEKLPQMLEIKAELAGLYRDFFSRNGGKFVDGIEGTSPNHWLNAIILEDLEAREAFLQHTNANGVMTRPIWRLMDTLPMFQNCQSDDLKNAKWLEERVVNLPSSVPVGKIGEL
ncbi:MAG: LegC family aminotransferase [Hyphomicrobiales bacterium]